MNTTVIMLVDDYQKYYNFRKCIVDYSGAEFAFLAITNNENIYEQMRDSLSLGLGERLVEYLDKTPLNFEDAKQFIKECENVVLLNPRQFRPIEHIKELVADFAYLPKAGVISVFSNDLIKLEDIYADEIRPVEVSLEGEYPKFDINTVETCITKYKNFMAFDFNMGLEKYTLMLRRKGYENYMDNKIGEG